jgi:hypothetical protein
MSEKKTIKVIKKGEKPRPIVKAKATAARETARDMVETVTNWVTEFQQKRRVEDTSGQLSLSTTYKNGRTLRTTARDGESHLALFVFRNKV